MEHEKPSYYGILPANVRYDKNLKPMEKIMYSEITALSNKHGYCNASNNYFAKLYEVHKNTISTWISNLKKQGYVNVEVIKNSETKEVEERRIYLSSIPINKNTYTPIREKVDTPIREIIEDNNTSNNNTSNNNIDISSTDFVNFVKEYKQIIVNSTKVSENIVAQNIFNILPTLKNYDCELLLKKIKESDFLMGKLERKPNVANFSRKTMIDRIMADEYKNKTFEKSQEKKEFKEENYTENLDNEELYKALGL